MIIRGVRWLALTVALVAPPCSAAGPGGLPQPSGEFLFWVSDNGYSMSSFNQWLTNSGWSSSDLLTGGLGLGMEFSMRWGRTVQNGFGFGWEVLFANLTKDWGYQGGNYGYQTDYFYLSNMHFMVKYSGSVPISPMFGINWDAGLGLGFLLATDNFEIFYSGAAYNEYYSFTPGIAPVFEFGGGPTLYLPGPQGLVLALRLGYRLMSFANPTPWHSDSSYYNYSSGTLPFGLDFSGFFVRFSIGFGNVGGPFGPKMGAGGGMRKVGPQEGEPAPPPRPY